MAIEKNETKVNEMKKMLYFLFLIFTVLFLSTCAKETNFIYYLDREDVAKIEIIHVITEWELEYEVINELDQISVEEFLRKLSEISYVKSLFGNKGTLDDETCIKITYNNGNFDILSTNLIVSYDSSGLEFRWEEIIIDKNILEKFTDLVEEFS
jgi:hypothetical protein